jgi:guanylate kinase
MGALDGFLSIFLVGEEDHEAFFTVLALIGIVGHGGIIPPWVMWYLWFNRILRYNTQNIGGWEPVLSMEISGYGHTQEPLLIVISGPSGVGKDAVLNKMKACDLPFHFVVTATDRPPRPDEVHGVDYFFISADEFKRMIEADELLEYALVYGENKGIPKQQVREALSSGKDVVMRIDVQGARTIKALEPDAVLIFLTTCDEDELANRLKTRHTESEEKLKIRIETAHQEFKRLPEFDYKVVNRENQLDETVDTILAIIEAEHHRTRPRKVTL